MTCPICIRNKRQNQINNPGAGQLTEELRREALARGYRSLYINGRHYDLTGRVERR